MPVSVRRPKAIVFDILGTASKSGFLEKILFPFLKINLDGYINTHWAKKDFIKLYEKIEQQSVEFNRQEPNTPVVLPHENLQAKPSLLNFINFVTDNGINSTAVTQLRFKVWFEGYQQSKLHTPIYSDVPKRCRQWFAEGIKFYVFSNTWVEAQKALLRNTNHGDLTNLISGHYDNDFGPINEPDSWRRLCAEIHENPNEVLFLTKSPAEAHAASEAGVAVVLVLTHRHNVKAISKEDRTRFAYVRTLNDLGWLEGSMMPTSSAAATAPTERGFSEPMIQGPLATAMSAPPTSSLPVGSGNTAHGSSSAAAGPSGAAGSRPAASGSHAPTTLAGSGSSAARSSGAVSGATSGASSGATPSSGGRSSRRPSQTGAGSTSTRGASGSSAASTRGASGSGAASTRGASGSSAPSSH